MIGRRVKMGIVCWQYLHCRKGIRERKRIMDPVTVGCRWIYSCTYLGLFYVRDRKKVQVTRKRTCNGTCKYIRQCFGPCTYPCKSVWTVIILHENVLDRASTHVIPFRWNVKWQFFGPCKYVHPCYFLDRRNSHENRAHENFWDRVTDRRNSHIFE